MNYPAPRIALYGGTFDPVHLGHLAVARAAVERFSLDRLYFVPADVQPLKSQRQTSAFEHRYAMLALALQGEPRLLPSLLEAPGAGGEHRTAPSYTVETLRRVRTDLGGGARLFFLIGMDAFRQIAQWRQPVELLRAAEFIIASRPGHSLDAVTQALPPELRPNGDAMRVLEETGTLETSGATLHLLPDVHEEVSSTAIREAVRSGLGLENLVPTAVAEYIRKLNLYGAADEPRS